MSKYVKGLQTDEIQRRLEGVESALLVSVSGMRANSSYQLRKQLREKNIKLMVVRNGLARRATEGTALAPAFKTTEGPTAVVWGGTDIVALAKEIVRLSTEKEFEPLQCRGGVLDGQRLTADDVKDVSNWPTREEQLSIVAGQILSVGGALSSQLLAAGGRLASQIDKLAGDEDGADEAAEAAEG